MGADREPNDVVPGTVINGKFRVLALIATGGMGRIFRAEQAPLGRVVALKVLRTPNVDSDQVANEFRRRFDREASILAKLQHVNVVTLFDYGRIETEGTDRYFMAMEMLQGETLAQRLRSQGTLSPQETLRIVRQMARGLREAHRLGAVHRDLKPSNVMLVPEEDGGEIVKILDFGIGKLLGADDDQEITQEGSFLGSPKYIAPEQVNERRVDARTDVYALGVITYECLCGRVPFEGETNLETILAHYNKELPAMAQRSPGVVVPEAVEAFARRCLEKSPANRPQNMEEVLRLVSDCERLLFGSTSLGGLHSYPPPTSQGSLLPPARHSDHSTLALTPHPAPRPSGGTVSSLTRSQAPSAGPAPSSRTGIVVGVAAVLLLAAGAAALRFAGHSTSASAATSSAPPPLASVAVAPAVPATVVLQPPAGSDLGAPPATATTPSAGAAPGSPPAAEAPSAPSASAAPTTPPQARVPRWIPPAPQHPTAAPPPSHPPQDPDIKLQR